MKYIAFLLLTATFISIAQVPVKKDIMKMIENCPKPPADMKDAFSKVVTTSEYGTSKCSAEKLFESIEKEVKNVEAEYESQKKDPSNFAPPGMNADDMKKMTDPEMRKKMKSMNKEEKIKMAMEMMKTAPGGRANEMDPPPVREALDEWQKIYNNTEAEYNRSVAEQQQDLKLEEEYQKEQEDITLWEAAEVKRLPQIGSGEMSAPDPVKLKELNLKVANKHIVTAEKWLESIQKRWQASIDRIKSRYSEFYKKLIAADYASGTKKFSSKKILSDAQMIIFKDIVSQVQKSRHAYESAAIWQARKIDIEKKVY